MDNIKVLLVEDIKIVRLGFSLVIENAEGIELIGEAEDGKSGIRMAQELHPDVILMDIGLPEIDGIKATSMIKKTNPDIRILIYTSREAEDDVFDSLSAGADGYIMKGTSEENLINAIKAVAEGTAWLDPAIARLVLSNIKKQSNDNPPTENNTQQKNLSKNIYGLTSRELEVLALIVEGLDNIEISKRLVITVSTAKAHVHSILGKLFVKNRTQATIQAVKEGLI